MKKQRIALITGGWSREREVSLLGGENVFKALNRKEYDVIMLDPLNDFSELFENAQNIDLGFILLHGKYGEDGCLQGLMEILGIPYVGSGVLASAVAANKRVAKEIFKSENIPVAEHLILEKGHRASLKSIFDALGDKMIVKPLGEGSSFGMTVCENEGELEQGLAAAFECGNEIMIEAFIKGREITCCVLGTHELETLPIIEIIPQENARFFDYEAKYKPGATKEVCPAPIDPKLETKAKEYAVKAHKALGCSVWSRSDMIIHDKEIFMLETNTIPGMTHNSLFPLAAKEAGMSFSDLVEKLISLSLEKHEIHSA